MRFKILMCFFLLPVLLFSLISCNSQLLFNTESNLGNGTFSSQSALDTNAMQNSDETQSDGSTIGIEAISKDDMFTQRDENISYDESLVDTIVLSDNASVSSSPNVIVSGNTITIKSAGTYLISGALENGNIIVDAPDDDKLHIILNGVDVTCKTSAALYIKNADKVFVTLAEDSVNTFSNENEFVAIDENNIDAVVFSKEDITLNGSGTLNIYAAYGHGIVSKDDLTITSGYYNITSQKHALCGKDCVKIAGGVFDLIAGSDGIHSENADDGALGFIYISDGDFTVRSGGDGLDSNYYTQIHGGTFDISADGKGIKATADLLIENGNFTISSVDDSIHSNSNVNINSGIITCSTNDDGIHADENVKICGAEINIVKSYEGIEGLSIDICGGSITIFASDDGLNAAGGNDQSGFGGIFGGFGGRDNFGTSSNSYINISGGVVCINSSGDGIDSNGSLYISGGEIYVSGPSDNANAALDYDGTATITGGILIASGSSGMVQNFGSSSTQGSILLTLSSYSTADISICDDGGNILAKHTPENRYNCVIISAPSLQKGNTYTVSAGGINTSVTLTNLIWSSSSGGGINPSFPGGRW